MKTSITAYMTGWGSITMDTPRDHWIHLLRPSASLNMKGCICHSTKWQIHPFISNGTLFNWIGRRGVEKGIYIRFSHIPIYVDLLVITR